MICARFVGDANLSRAMAPQLGITDAATRRHCSALGRCIAAQLLVRRAMVEVLQAEKMIAHVTFGIIVTTYVIFTYRLVKFLLPLQPSLLLLQNLCNNKHTNHTCMPIVSLFFCRRERAPSHRPPFYPTQ